MLTDDDLQDALCFASEEVGRVTFPDLVIGCVAGYTPPPPPPPNLCAGNTAPSISSVELDGTAVLEGGTVHVVVGTPYVITVNASDPDGILGTLTYSATVDGIPVGTVVSNVVTVTPLVAGTFEVYVNVFDGCLTTTWGPVTVEESHPSISIIKTADPQTYSAAGQPITYSFLVTNTGNVTLTGIDVVDLDIPFSSTIASLAPGASVTLTEIYTITQADLDAGSFTNTVEVTTFEGVSDTAYAMVHTESLPGISISKVARQSTYSMTS